VSRDYADKSVSNSHQAPTNHGLDSFAFRRSCREGITCLSSAVVPLVCLSISPHIGFGSLIESLYSYAGNDPIGLELAGALKNVYAIASGMSEGLGFENNTRASQSTTIHWGIRNVC
jgi:NAD-dependent glycerol-3-phosphate dehydrogenase C-terminus